MDSRFNHALVGLFVILLGLGGMGLALWLTMDRYQGDTQIYRIYMTESVSGLYVDAPVKYHGLQVGRILDLGLDPGDPAQVRVEVEVLKEVPITRDTRAVLTVQGLTGIASIELNGGTRESTPLLADPGEPYPVIPTGPSLYQRLDAMLSDSLERVARVADDLHRLLGAENQVAFAQLLTRLSALAGMLTDREGDLDRLLAEAEGGLREGRQALAEVPALVADLRATLRQFDRTAAGLDASAAAVQAGFADTNDSLRRAVIELEPRLAEVLASLSRMSGSLRQTSDELRRDPRVLLHGPGLGTPGPGE